MEDDKKILVCICTYERPVYLKACIESFKNIKIPDNCNFTICIVDNNKKEQAKELVKDFIINIPEIEFKYIHEPKRGIIHARNKALSYASSLNPNILGFVDDDCIVHENWLVNGYNGLLNHNGEIVTGPCNFLLPEKSQQYLKETNVFGFRVKPNGVNRGLSTTRNVLIKYDILKVTGLKFHEAFNLSGGSDAFLFQQLKKLGYTIVWIQEFNLSEQVPKSRANLKWVLKRNFRIGVTRVKRSQMSGEKYLSKTIWLFFSQLPLLILKTIFYLPINYFKSIRFLEEASALFGSFSKLFIKDYSEYHIHHGE